MKLNVFCFLSIAITLTSCYWQNSANAIDRNIPHTIGDTVTELSNNIIVVFHASNGKYWFGSDKDGLYCVDGRSVMHFSTKDGLLDNRIRSILEDTKGNVYISSLGGINKFDGISFTTLTPVKGMQTEDNWNLQTNDLWFCMAGKAGERGPYRYDGNNLYQLEFPKHYMADEYFARFPNNTWSPYEVYYIYKDSKGTMWFGTSNFGICRYDGHSFNWLYEDHLTNVPNGGSFGIRSIMEDSKGKYWFCNTRYRFNISTDSTIENGRVLVNYEKEKGIDGIISADGADCIYFMSAVEDGSHDLWLATYNEGVWRYDGKKATHYPVKIGSKAITLFSIYKDKQGKLWLGTHEAGAYLFNGTKFEKFIP